MAPATEPLPPLPPATGTILVHALSGLGKSTLAERYPSVTHDTDVDLDATLAEVFPALQGRARRIAWRALARQQPWRDHTAPDFTRWARGRRALVARIRQRVEHPGPCMVFTNLLMLPLPIARHHGVELGRYAEHWHCIARDPDNHQDEALNARLEGFAPLRRLPPGRFLADEPEIVRWLDEASRVTRM